MLEEQRWRPIPLYAPLFTNVDETALRNGWPALENAYVTEARGHSRMPGLKLRAQLPNDDGRVYLFAYDDDLFAVTSRGRTSRIGRDLSVRDVTDVLVTGDGRPTFGATEEDLLIAAGGPIVAYREPLTRKLSDQAPLATHVVYYSQYALANEPGSARFRHTEAGAFTSWPILNTLTANSVADPITSLAVNQFGEVFVAGPRSIEQWERNTSGASPFFFRWLVPAGLLQPHLIVAGDDAVFVVNQLSEICRVSGQVAQPVSGPIQRTLEKIDDATEAWCALAQISGQRFLIVQFPNATNSYGTKGVTILYDYRLRRFSFLFGFDEDASAPGRWPVWSLARVWERTFAGGDGGAIYEFDDETYAQDAGLSVMTGRSGHWEAGGQLRCADCRLRFKRGQDHAGMAKLQLRVNRDNMGWSPWLEMPIGADGDRRFYARTGPLGTGRTWQFEYRITQPMAMEIVGLEVKMEGIGR